MASTTVSPLDLLSFLPPQTLCLLHPPSCNIQYTELHCTARHCSIYNAHPGVSDTCKEIKPRKLCFLLTLKSPLDKSSPNYETNFSRRGIKSDPKKVLPLHGNDIPASPQWTILSTRSYLVSPSLLLGREMVEREFPDSMEA